MQVPLDKIQHFVNDQADAAKRTVKLKPAPVLSQREIAVLDTIKTLSNHSAPFSYQISNALKMKSDPALRMTTSEVVNVLHSLSKRGKVEAVPNRFKRYGSVVYYLNKFGLGT